MTGLPVGCELWVDGARVADGLTQSDPHAPIALSGLAVSWGRGTTVDQPEPAILSAAILDRGAGPVRAQDMVALGSVAVVVAPAGHGWTVVGRNLFYCPPCSALAPFATNGFGSLSLVAGWGGYASAVRFTRTATGAARFTHTHGAAVGEQVTVTIRFRASVATTGVAIYLRPDVASSTDQVAITTGRTITAGTSTITFAPVVAPARGAAPGLAIVWNAGAVNDTLDITGLQMTPGTVPGTYFDGDTPDTATDRYAWTNTAQGSPSTHETGGDQSRPVVFAGRVTDLDLEYDTDAGGAVLSVIAADVLADLANRYVGAEPWAASTLAERAALIATKIGTGLAVTVDARPGALPVSRMDVDRQAAADLFRDLASSAYAALWVEVDAAGTPRLVIEDPAARPGQWMIGQGGDGLWRPVPGGSANRVLDTCAVDRDTITWRRATSDLITRVAVRWLDQTTSPDPTERSVGVVDPEPEVTYGARGLSLSTVLSTEAAATTIANVLLVTHQESQAWRAGDLTWDTDLSADTPASLDLAVDLLDNTTRYGMALSLSPLPTWTPAGAEAGMYVDGGTYRFVGGRWVLALLTTSAVGAGQSVTYAQTPRTARYVDWARDVSYLDLIGVGPPATVSADLPGRDGSPTTHGGVLPAANLRVPLPTDPYADTALALRNLAADLEPLFVKVPIYFLTDVTSYTSDTYADVTVNLSAYFTSVSTWMPAHYNNASVDVPIILQSVTHPQEAAGTIRFRYLQLAPPDGTKRPNVAKWISFVAWGTAK